MTPRLTLFTFMLIIAGVSAICQTTIILQPGPDEGKDAVLYTINPSTSAGETPQFKCMGWTHSGTPGVHRTLFDFDLSAIPPDATILEAKLSLYYSTYEPTYVTHSGSNMSYLVRVTEPWEELVTTWNTQPAFTMDDHVTLPQSTSPEQDYIDIDFTGMVQMRWSDPEHNFGWMLKLDNENPYNCLLFASSDCEDPLKRPRLVVTYLCDYPTAGFTYTSEGLTFHFQDTSHWAYAFDWDFGDLYYAAVPSPIHTYGTTGTYTVCQRVWNDCAADTFCLQVVAVNSGIGEQSGVHFSVFPNPADEHTFMKTSLSGKIYIDLFDLQGKKRIGTSLIIQKYEPVRIDTGSLSRGLYIIRISDESEFYYSEILIN